MMMDIEDVNTSSRWVKLLYYLWKIFTCLFLHVLLIALVVGYCVLGMYMFQSLEMGYEKQVSIEKLRCECPYLFLYREKEVFDT